MNNIWSTYIQKTETLYQSRTLRFSDIFKDKYINAFNIEKGKKILEIGCGPGTLSQALHRWYPESEIIGVDRDSSFIDFASNRASQIIFKEDDATNLSFPDKTFDVTISYTVQEHIDPVCFFGEQNRVLKDDGVCIVLSVRRGVNVFAPCVSEQTEFEKDIWRRAGEYYNEANKKYDVCAYPLNEAELPMTMELHGFRNVTTEYLTINLTPDNPIYPKQMAYAMINSNRQTALDSAESLLDIASDVVTADEVNELIRIINQKYDRRIGLYDEGIKQWDTSMTLTMIIRGIK